MISPIFDPYWEFDHNKHFRPKVSKADFFRLTGYPFLSVINQSIPEMLMDETLELTNAMKLSYGQKTLYYWQVLDSQVTSGGFELLYYNGYGQYMSTVIKGLNYIGDHEAAIIFQKAQDIYMENKDLMEEAREADFFDSDNDDELDEFTPLEEEYYKIHKKTRQNIEKYIRNHPKEFCLDEACNEIDSKYSGECRTFHANGKLKEHFYLKHGIIHGEFKSYFENGTLKERMVYSNEEGTGIQLFYHDGLLVGPILFTGKPTGEKEDYHENGNLKFKSAADDINKRIREESYDENGQLRKLEYKTMEKLEKVGEHKEWYENGQLKESGHYLDKFERIGEWLEYYPEGRLKLEGEFKERKFMIHHFYNEKGELLMKDGTGLFVTDKKYSFVNLFSIGSDRTELRFKNYRLDGISKAFKEGSLIGFQEYKDGKEHGHSRTYYKNGKVKEQSVYSDGKRISQEYFKKSDDPKENISFKYRMEDEWLLKKGLTIPDTYPVCINEDEIKQKIGFPQILFQEEYLYQDIDASTCLWLDVDEEGSVTDVEFSSAYMTNGDEFRQVAYEMEFMPAIKKGLPVKSCIYIIASFEIQ